MRLWLVLLSVLLILISTDVEAFLNNAVVPGSLHRLNVRDRVTIPLRNGARRYRRSASTHLHVKDEDGATNEVRVETEDLDSDTLLAGLPVVNDRRGFFRQTAGTFAALLTARAFGGSVVQMASAAPLSRVRLGSPIGTESVLLDLLPIRGKRADALRAIQTEIEKVTVLRTLYNRNAATGSTSAIPDSVWDQVDRVASNALDLLVNSRTNLEPVFREVDTAEVQIRRGERGEEQLAMTRDYLRAMVNCSTFRNATGVLEAQDAALYSLGFIGELLVPQFPFEVLSDDTSIPRLLGRATVDLTFREIGASQEQAKVVRSTSIVSLLNGYSAATVPPPLPSFGTVTLVVDGFSAPVTAGNFIDLCQRGFFDGLPVMCDNMNDPQVNATISLGIGGTFMDGFVNPIDGNVRRLPLEILRADPKKGNIPSYNAAKNTRIFTKAPPVQTFRIPGAIGSYHPSSDGNGGSSQFFWLTEDSLDPNDGVFMKEEADRLDGRYCIFAYATAGKKFLINRLTAGKGGGNFVLEKATVTYGADNLLKTKLASFKDILLQRREDED